MIKMNKALILKVLALCLLSALIGGIAVYASVPTTTLVLSGGNDPGGPSYTVFTDGANYFAKNGLGEIVYSGSDSDVIQDALDDGGDLYLTAGTYVITTELAVSVDNQKIEGSGKDTILSADPTLDDNVLGNSGHVEYVQVRNLAIDGNKASQTAGCGILFADVAYSIIDGCYIYDCKEMGIQFYLDGTDTYGNVISNNYVYDCDKDGIKLRSSYNNTVTGNTVIDCGATTDYYGIFDSSGGDNIISNNHVFGSGGHGICAGTAENDIIDGNIASYNTRHGIFLYYNISNSVVSNNICNYNGYNGLGSASQSSSGSYHLVFVGNHAEGNTWSGISLSTNCSFATVTGNTLVANVINGIDIYGCNYCTISANTCNGNLGFGGIRLRNTSQNNAVIGNTVDGTSGGNYGILEADSADYNLIDGNICRNNALDDILTIGGNSVEGDNIET